MKKNNYKSEVGAVSMFVMLSMAFLLVTIVGIYMISSKRAQTQIESLNMVQGKYYTEGDENEKYSSKIATTDEIIPIYTKEQLWSIGENKKIEIEGKIYDFSTTELSKYELKNDIIINIETDLENSKFKDNLVFGIKDTIIKNDYDILYYYNEDYYVPVQYSDGTTITTITENQAVLSASGDNFSNISTTITGLSGKYYLFGYKNISEDLGYVTDGLMVHYDGINNTATGHKSNIATWKDLSGNGRDGVLNGCTWEKNDLSFNGENDAVAIGEMNYTTPTIEAVVKFDNVGDTEQSIICNFEASGYGLNYINSKNGFQIYTDKYYHVYGTTPTTEQIYSLSGRYDGSTIYLRENESLNSVTASGTIKTSSNNTILALGCNPRGSSPNLDEKPFSGKIYSIRVYNRALTDEEVMQNYERDKIRFGIE